jgi:hypothetical protein
MRLVHTFEQWHWIDHFAKTPIYNSYTWSIMNGQTGHRMVELTLYKFSGRVLTVNVHNAE